jgi:molybdopterin-guanine dinucleotide biosynthesis protein B
MTIIVGIAGFKNTGKTTLVERLVEHLTSLKLRVATLKHAHHNFQVDRPGTDSARHQAAGAAQTIIVSSSKMANLTHFSSPDDEPSLQQAMQALSPADIVLVEGWKGENHAKIVIAASIEEVPDLPNMIAIAVPQIDTSSASDLPVFQRDDISSIARLILEQKAEKP